MKTALQVYGLREFLGSDMENVLKRVKEMGYDGVEWPFFAGHTPEEAVSLTKAAGLEVFSVHVNYDDIAACDRDRLAQLKALGFDYFVIGWLPVERLPDGPLYEETSRKLRTFAEAVHEIGGRLLYHNHDFDLVRVDGEKRRLDLLLADYPAELLGSELDTCWVAYGGADVNSYLEAYGDRAPIVHLKDYKMVGGKFEFRAVGAGCLGFAEILARCGKAEWLCVEQDDPTPGKDAFACAEESLVNLKKLL